jgi:mannose-6-phosphate isomerase-like protein (cupin superfamily)
MFTLRIAAAALLLSATTSLVGAADWAPVVTPAGQAKIIHPMGNEIEVLATALQTGGQLGMVVLVDGPGGGPRPMAHSATTETWYVLEGHYQFMVAGQTYDAPTGSAVVVPPNTQHNFQNIGTTPGKVLAIFTPGGFEDFFIQWDATGANTPEAINALEKAHGLIGSGVDQPK